MSLQQEPTGGAAAGPPARWDPEEVGRASPPPGGFKGNELFTVVRGTKHFQHFPQDPFGELCTAKYFFN